MVKVRKADYPKFEGVTLDGDKVTGIHCTDYRGRDNIIFDSESKKKMNQKYRNFRDGATVKAKTLRKID